MKINIDLSREKQKLQTFYLYIKPKAETISRKTNAILRTANEAVIRRFPKFQTRKVRIIVSVSTLVLAFVLLGLSNRGFFKLKLGSVEKHVGHDENEVPGGHGDEDEAGHNEEVLQLSDEQMKESGIILAKAATGEIREGIDVPGEVALHPNGSAHVNPRYAGVVKEVNKNLGDQVNVGDVLASVESNVGLQRYPLKASLSGVIIKRQLMVGEFVTESTDAFTIANLSTVLVNLTVYQRDLLKIKKGQNVIITNSDGLTPGTGEIFFVAPVVDETTRTAVAAVNLQNPDGLWRPGGFVNGHIILNKIEVPVRIPRTAVQLTEQGNVVFVKEKNGLTPREVHIGRRDKEFFEVTDGLKDGEEYVSDGAFVLKAELSKESAGHEH